MQNKEVSKTVWTVLTWMIIVTLLVSGCSGQEKKKTYKVGMLVGLEVIMPIADGFKEGMTELGYVEGENITYDVQVVNFDIPGYREIIKKFIADKVDLIVVMPTEATIEAKTLTKDTDIPVVFTYAFTEGTGLIDSIGKPGGNITGVRFPGVDVQLKRYEIMRKIAPDAKRLFMPYQRGYPIVAAQLEALEPMAKEDGVTLIPFPVDTPEELQTELDKRAAAEDPGMDAVLMLVEPFLGNPSTLQSVFKFVSEHKLLFGGAYDPGSAARESLFGVLVDLAASGKQAAPLADKILKGTPAGIIPVVSAENYIQINYKQAQKLGLTVPESILKQADEIIR